MSTFYSIIYCQIRPEIKEQLSIAMLMVTGNKVFYKISWDKLALLKHLLPIDSVELIKMYLEGISKKVRKFDSKLESEKVNPNITLVPTTPDQFNYFRFEFLDTLNKYNNNLIGFSKPQYIDIDGTDEQFHKLYSMMVSTDGKIAKSKDYAERIKIVKNNMYPKLSLYTNIDVSIDKIPNLDMDFPISSFPKKIDILGENGSIMSAQFVDFEKQEYNLTGELSHYNIFIMASEKNGMYYIIGDEPQVKDQENMKIWRQWKAYSKVKILPLSEIQEVEEYCKENNVQPVQLLN